MRFRGIVKYINIERKYLDEILIEFLKIITFKDYGCFYYQKGYGGGGGTNVLPVEFDFPRFPYS